MFLSGNGVDLIMANSMPELAYALLRKNGFSRATSLGFIVDMYLVVNDA